MTKQGALPSGKDTFPPGPRPAIPGQLQASFRLWLLAVAKRAVRGVPLTTALSEAQTEEASIRAEIASAAEDYGFRECGQEGEARGHAGSFRNE